MHLIEFVFLGLSVAGPRSSASATSTAPCQVDTLWQWAEPSDAAIARQVKEYALGYADSTSLTIFVTRLEAGARAERAQRVELTRRFGSYHLAAAKFRQVKYSYRQLQSWYECLLRADQSDIRLSSLAAVENRVILHVRDEAARKRVNALARELRIPPDALLVKTDSGIPQTYERPSA